MNKFLYILYIGGISIIIVYLFLLLMDCIFGMGTPTKRRVKKKGNKYVIQETWILSPFWSDVAYGDLLGCVFEQPSFDTLEEATKGKDLMDEQERK